MDLRTRLIAPLFLPVDNENKIFDIDAFVKRSILFETFIINSEGLREIPHLIRIFGFDGLLAIFESGSIKLNCLAKTTASLPPNYFINEAPSSKMRPPLHYSFAEVKTSNLYQHLNLLFEKIEPDLDLSSRQIVKMRKTIYSSLEKPQDDGNRLSLKNTRNDLILYPDLLAKTLVMTIKKQFSIQANYQDIKVEIQYENDDDFYASSNIQRLFNFDTPTTHKVIERACLAIANRNDRIEQMRAYSALSGFNDIDIPVFGEKLAFLASAVNPNIDEQRFQRVVELNGLPQIKNDENIRIDAKKLLEIKESTEAKEFRHWLSTTDGMSDIEIIKQVGSLSKTIGRFIGGEVGQNIRFFITNGVGYIPIIGTPISTSLSILDHFLLDKIFPRSGVAAFISDMYPSLFKD